MSLKSKFGLELLKKSGFISSISFSVSFPSSGWCSPKSKSEKRLGSLSLSDLRFMRMLFIKDNILNSSNSKWEMGQRGLSVSRVHFPTRNFCDFNLRWKKIALCKSVFNESEIP